MTTPLPHPSRPRRELVLAAGGALLATAALVYTPPLDVVVLVLTGPGILASALAAWTGRRWVETLAAALVAIPAALVLFLFGEISWLLDPHRGPWTDYLSIVLLATALPLSLATLLAHAPRLSLSPPRARALILSLLLFAAGASAATVAALASSPARALTHDVEPEARVHVVLRDASFEPREVVLAAGVLTEIVVENRDDVWHTFSYPRGDDARHHRVPALETVRILVRFDEPTQMALWCEPHPEMGGTLLVASSA